MSKQTTFGHAELAKKMALQFGNAQEPVEIEMRHGKEVQAFIQRIDDARKKAGKSKLVFR